MQKIKYIIIATLLLALAIIYFQLLNYKNISSLLLKENTNLLNKIDDLNANIVLLNYKIISLEESLSIEIELYKPFFTNDINTTNMLQENLNPLNKMQQETEESTLTPNINLDEENKIIDFGLEYKHEF